MDPKQPLGVVVFVRYREAWYSLSEEQQRAWRKRQSQADWIAKGAKRYGVYNAPLGTRWDGMEFWEFPDYDTLEEAMTTESGTDYLELQYVVGRKVGK